MKKTFLLYTLIISLFIVQEAYSQWGAGLSVNLREEVPKRGLGFTITRNLPYQFPAFGLKVRFEADLFLQTINGVDLKERDLFFSLTGTYFLKLFEPYISFGPGVAFNSADDETSTSFILMGLAGVQLAAIEPVYPFLELKGQQYFSEGGEQDFHWIGSLGVRFEF